MNCLFGAKNGARVAFDTGMLNFKFLIHNDIIVAFSVTKIIILINRDKKMDEIAEWKRFI